MSNSLDPDQDRYTVSPDLGPNSLQRLSVDTSGPRVKWKICEARGNIGPDLIANCLIVKLLSVLTFVLGAQKKHLY